MVRQRLLLILWALFSTFGTALATSTLRGVAPRKGLCQVGARYLGSELNDGRVLWKFARMTAERNPECAKLPDRFSAWVWSGSYSKLTSAFVYPVSLSEPKINSPVKVKLEYRTVRESRSRNQVAAPLEGWFLEGNPE